MIDMDDPDFDIFSPTHAASVCDGGPDDLYWQTAAGVQLRNEMDAVVAEQTQQKSERDALEAERLNAWRATQAELAAKAAEEAEIAKRELAERVALAIAEADAAREKRDLELAAVRRQDADYHGFEICLYFKIEGPSLDGQALEEDNDPERWELDEDAVINSRMIGEVTTAATTAFAHWTTHLHSLGLTRADRVNVFQPDEPCDDFTGPSFLLIHQAADADLCPETLGNFAPVKISLALPHGAILTLIAVARPTNPTKLYEAVHLVSPEVGQWGGEATPDGFPLPDESRNEWLARVCTPRVRLARQIERWVASGRQPNVYRAYGDFTERDTGNRSTDWLVKGVLARGVITLLAGDSTAGKTSLVHEWCAALGGQAVGRPRTVLGQEVTGRIVCVFITGEGDAGMDFKRSTAHARAWGPATYAKFNGTAHPLAELLLALRGMPNIDLLVVDPMRAFLTGDEKSSDTVNEFYKPLEAFAEALNCAVVVTQHFTKSGQKGRALDDMKLIVRGSGTVVERPRMVIVMDKLRDGTIRIAPAKHNLAEEELWVRSSQWSLWRRDPETHTLVPLNDAAAVSTDTGGNLTRVLDAIAALNEIGTTLRKTGEHELFEQKLPALAGLSRGKIRSAVAALIDDNRVDYGPSGLVAIPAERRTEEGG